jgi:hypothetical protein
MSAPSMLVAFGKPIAILIRYEMMVQQAPSLALTDPPTPTTPIDHAAVKAARKLHAAQRTLISAIFRSLPMRPVKAEAGELHHVVELRRSLASTALTCSAVTVAAAPAVTGTADSGTCPLTGAYVDTRVTVTLDHLSVSVHPAWANVLHLLFFIATIPERIKEIAETFKEPTTAAAQRAVVFGAHVLRCVELLCTYFACDPFMPLRPVRTRACRVV